MSADLTPEQRNFAHYAVGDLDPTPSDDVHGEGCSATNTEDFWCTWAAGHEHPQHVAGDGDQVCAVWNVDVEP